MNCRALKHCVHASLLRLGRRLLLRLLQLQHLLHDLLLLDQEGAHNAIAHRAAAEHAAVCTVHRLLVVRHALAAVLSRAKPRHLHTCHKVSAAQAEVQTVRSSNPSTPCSPLPRL